MATTNPWHYAGSYTDTATGYLKLGTRYYNPTTARFTQPDPSGKEANTYNYASCNPINNTDPTGLDGLGCAEASVGGFIAVAGFFAAPTGVGLLLMGLGLAAGEFASYGTCQSA
jgi:RHS repeat-associated protein